MHFGSANTLISIEKSAQNPKGIFQCYIFSSFFFTKVRFFEPDSQNAASKHKLGCSSFYITRQVFFNVLKIYLVLFNFTKLNIKKDQFCTYLF